MHFTQKELHAIDCALSLAASVYEADAKAMWETSPRLSEQMTRQAHEARVIADRIAQEV